MEAKTVIDAVNEFKGVFPYVRPSIVYHKGMEKYSDYYEEEPTELYKTWQFICNVQQFNQCVEDCSNNFGKESKSTYTQAMANHNILPLVGMECMVICEDDLNPSYHKCTIDFIGKFKMIATTSQVSERVFDLDEVKFKATDTRSDTEKAIDDLSGKGCEHMAKENANDLLDDIKSGKIHGVTWSKS